MRGKGQLFLDLRFNELLSEMELGLLELILELIEHQLFLNQIFSVGGHSPSSLSNIHRNLGHSLLINKRIGL